MNEVSFPNLGITVEMNPTVSVFGLDIAWYAIIIVCGMILALLYTSVRVKQFGYDFDQLVEVIFFAIIFGIIGARLYYVAFRWSYYSSDLTQIFNIRSGGLAIYGGIIGAVLAGMVVFKIKKLPMLPFLDLAMIGLLLGQGIGRWGNFVNVEAYGDPDQPCTNLFAMEVAGEDALVHPCFLYESVWCLLGFLLLHFLSKRRRFDGEVVLWYCMWYGVERTVVEGLRSDSLMLGNWRVSQLLSALLVVAAAIIYIVMLVRVRRCDDPEKVWLYVKTEKSRASLAALKEQREAEKDSAAQKRRERKARRGGAIPADEELKKAAQNEFGLNEEYIGVSAQPEQAQQTEQTSQTEQTPQENDE